MEFMLICSKKNVEVVCIDKVEDAQTIFRRIQELSLIHILDSHLLFLHTQQMEATTNGIPLLRIFPM